ncbi:MAG: DNA recombination protein RmuC, partial [Parvularculaceae bacterium]|nr:DNA recombination protein RmuC [Parvularculaceae bacterium]
MQVQAQPGPEPATPAQGAPSEPQPAGATTDAPVLKIIDGPPPVLWGGFITFALVFGVLLFFLSRSRIAAGKPSTSSGKPGEDPIFQPAGDDAEITFEDGTTVVPAAVEPEAPKPRRGLFGFGRKDAKSLPVAEPEPDVSTEAAGLAEQAAPAPEEAPAPIPRPKKPAPFSNLFGRKRRDEEPALPPDPPANDETESTVEIIREDEPEAEPPSAAVLSRSVFAAARNEEDDWRRRMEEERRAAERADEERRFLAEEELRRDFERRAQAEREAEFERRKLTASLDQRMQALDARERALKDRELSATLEANALRAEIQREFDAKFAELSQRLERSQRPAAPAEAPSPLRELDTRIIRLSDRSPATAGDVAAGGDERSGAVGELARRLAEHRDAINSSIEQMQIRIDLIAGAPQDVRALRDEIISLKRALGERVTGPSAPTVQLSDIMRDALPPDAFEMRAMLPNNRKADCLVRLPHPPGPIAIDARFPVEAFSKLHQPGADQDPRAENEFRRVALRHIVDIAERLIVPNETADSALMFIPSETMYSELHARFPDVVQDSFRARVWIVSPTTLMATLHTMRAVLRDARTRQNAEFIQTEAAHVLAEVDGLRRRVVALEDNFNRVREDFRGLLSSTDQVYRRAE